jgi:hypothetical protein
MTSWRPVACALSIAVVLVTAGCGGDEPATTDARRTAANSPASATTTTLPASESVTSTTKAGSASATPSTTAPAASGGATTTVTLERPEYRIDMRFASSCLRAGREQTIFVDQGRKGVVVYNAVYSDGKNAYDSDYYGGNDGGPTDDQGRYHDSWVVGAGAPAGPVEVTVLGLDGQRKKGEGIGHFSIADAQGRCA